MLKLERIFAGYKYKTAVKNINLELKPGEHLLVSGTPKSGKTALLQTAAGIIPPICGFVFLDYLPITEYSRRELSKKLCYIPQDLLYGEKREQLLSAISRGCEYILFDEPFAFLSAPEAGNLLDIMLSHPACSFVITETSDFSKQPEGFKHYTLPSTMTVHTENAIYM